MMNFWEEFWIWLTWDRKIEEKIVHKSSNFYTFEPTNQDFIIGDQFFVSNCFLITEYEINQCLMNHAINERKKENKPVGALMLLPFAAYKQLITRSKKLIFVHDRLGVWET